MSQMGIGAMLAVLGGTGSCDPALYVGRMISAAELLEEGGTGDGAIRLTFDDGKVIEIFDYGRSCCESRYITTDDELWSLVGRRLTRIEARDGGEVAAEYDTHEQVFVEIGTDQNFVTIVTHNEHNGYYGGFALTIREIA